MYRAKNLDDGNVVSASNYAYYLQSKEGYVCICCGKKVIAVQRSNKSWRPYFKHYASEACSFNEYECSSNHKSVWHKEWQDRFPEENREVYFHDDENEKNHIADIFINNTVIEFQHSLIDEDKFYERTDFYAKQGYFVVWLFDTFRDAPYLFQKRNSYVLDWHWRKPLDNLKCWHQLHEKYQDKVLLFFQKGFNDIIHEVLDGNSNYSDLSTGEELRINDFVKAVSHIEQYIEIRNKEILKAEERAKEQLQREREAQKAAEEARKIAEEQRKEAERLRQAQKALEEKRRLEIEKARKAELEKQRLAKEQAQKALEEQRRKAFEQRKKELEQRKLAEEQAERERQRKIEEKQQIDLKNEVFRVVQNEGMPINENSYKKFFENNSYWLTNVFVPYEKDYIVALKYQFQIVEGHYKCSPDCQLKHKSLV